MTLRCFFFCGFSGSTSGSLVAVFVSLLEDISRLLLEFCCCCFDRPWIRASFRSWEESRGSLITYEPFRVIVSCCCSDVCIFPSDLTFFSVSKKSIFRPNWPICMLSSSSVIRPADLGRSNGSGKRVSSLGLMLGVVALSDMPPPVLISSSMKSVF